MLGTIGIIVGIIAGTVTILGGFAGIVKWIVSSEIKPINTALVSLNEKMVKIDERIFRLESVLIEKKT